MEIRRLGYALGAEITGVDVRSLDDAQFERIRQAWFDNLALCLRDQTLTKDEFVAFARRFGDDLDDNRSQRERAADNPYVTTLSTKTPPGERWNGYKNGHHWHSDRSYVERPANGTFVLAKEVPEVGGDTMFANMCMAFETLSPALQQILEGLSAVHDQASFYGDSFGAGRRRAFTGQRDITADNTPPVVHPVVKTHPATGRKALYVGERVRKFVGMTEEESRPLIAFLNAHAVRYEFQYRHRWRVDDLVLWDNRCLMHYATLDYDPQTQPRLMWRCGTVGDAYGSVYDPGAEREAVAAGS